MHSRDDDKTTLGCGSDLLVVKALESRSADLWACVVDGALLGFRMNYGIPHTCFPSGQASLESRDLYELLAGCPELCLFRAGPCSMMTLVY